MMLQYFNGTVAISDPESPVSTSFSCFNLAPRCHPCARKFTWPKVTDKSTVPTIFLTG
ncbi:hypothetical protein HanIR_Chr15g0736001 [Helianthus annuus]|nr:hypothetical protein HanIR_Chr15g0736001 [Helianthus annuus]